MPLTLNCPCGKQLRVRDDSAGGRVRCPACERVLNVPAGNGAPAPPRPAAAPPPPADAIRFACSCGKQLRVKAEFAGRMTRCPDCNTQFTIPAAGGGTAAPPAKARLRPDLPPAGRPGRDDDDRDDRPSRRRDDEDDDRPRRSRRDDDEEDRPRRGRRDDDEEERGRRPRRKAAARGSGLTWLLVGAAALLLLVGGGVTAWLLFRSPKAGPGGGGGGGGGQAAAAPDLDFVPADVQGFVTIRVAALMKDDALTRFAKQAARQGGGPPTDLAADFEKETGLRASEIDRVTIVFKDVEKENAWAVVRTASAYDQKQILGKLAGARELKHEGKSYHVGRSGQPGPGAKADDKLTAIHFASPQVLIFGSEAGVKSCLSFAAGGAKGKGPLSDALARAGGEHHVVGAFQPSADQAKMLKDSLKAMLGPQSAQYQPLLDAQLATLVGDFGETVKLEATLRYADDGQAGRAKRAADSVMSMLESFRQQAEESLKKGAPPEMRPSIEAMKEAAGGVSVEQKGAELIVRFSVASRNVENFFPPQGGRPPQGKPPQFKPQGKMPRR